jgi:hypothetical protein
MNALLGTTKYTIVYPHDRQKKVPKNYLNVFGILDKVTIKFWKFLAFF